LVGIVQFRRWRAFHPSGTARQLHAADNTGQELREFACADVGTLSVDHLSQLAFFCIQRRRSYWPIRDSS
jgi:hypothetical protein